MNKPLTENTRNQVSFSNKMSVRMRSVATGALLAVLFSSVQAAEMVNEELEPCLNGEVSASGNYVSDAEEMRARSMIENADTGRLALEPCVNGEVSATGAFQTQALEDQFNAEVAMESRVNGGVSLTGEFPTQMPEQESFAHSQ